MSLLDATIPANTEAVKLGAQRIRELKAAINATLGLIFSDSSVPTWVTNIIPGASLVNASVTDTQLATAAVITAKLAAGAVTAAKATPDAFFYATGTFGAGTPCTYTITLSPALGALTTGAKIVFKASAANTGATNLIINGLTSTALKKNRIIALAAGDIASGQIVEATYDGSNFQMLTPPATAVSSTGTDFVAAAAGAAKVWAKFHWSGSAIVIDESLNVSGIVRNGTGDYTISFTTPFAAGTFSYSVSVKGDGAVGNAATADTGAAGAKRIKVYSSDLERITAADLSEVCFQAWGTQ